MIIVICSIGFIIASWIVFAKAADEIQEEYFSEDSYLYFD